MCALVRFCVALVLCGVAHARPDPGANDINPNDKQTQVASTVVAVENRTDVPINERYPHAVLFVGTCGGTIISPKWILTAAHCTLSMGPAWQRTVVAGTNRTNDGSGQSRSVKRLVIHPLFSVGPYWLDADEFGIKQVGARWDFLLAELSEPLPLDGKTMKAATLDDQVTLPAGLEVGYAGYGTEHHGRHSYMRSIIHRYELTVLTDEVCSSLEQYDAKDMLCARGLKDHSCNGDSGSGLVDSTGRVVGVLSWGEKDVRECRDGNISVFSRVGAVRDWIRQVTEV